MLKHMLDPSDKDRAFSSISKGDDTVLLVNNLGGVSCLELGGITSEVMGQLEKSYGIKPVRVLSGTYMTSLNGLGFSISLLKVVNSGASQSLLDLLDAPAEATGWSAAVKSGTWSNSSEAARDTNKLSEMEAKPSGLILDVEQAKSTLDNALDKVIAAEPEITKYDTVVGDGDCGIGLKRGAEAVKKVLTSTKATDAALFVDEITAVVETSMDGTSGALYAIYLNALAAALRSQSEDQKADSKVWAKAARSATNSMAKYTPAKPGDRTLVDALEPFVDTLERTGDIQEAAKAARNGADKTKAMKASLGRTVYVGGDGWQDVPDPGAYGLAIFFEGLAEGSVRS